MSMRCMFYYPHASKIRRVFTETDRLFDMDGTLVDSTAGVVGAWQIFAQTYPGIDVHNILSCEHRVNGSLAN